MKESQAMPLSIHTTGRFGKRSGRPFITQLARCTMLHSENEIACMVRNRLSWRT